MDEVERGNRAEGEAERNWRANLRALGGVQPRVAEAARGEVEGVEWVYGRDGALTALVEGKWWSGTSLPGRVAKSVLGAFVLQGGVACFLNPTHASQVRVVLGMLGPGQAVVVAVPDVRTLRLILHGEDFSGAIEGHRLWLCEGEGWAGQLEGIFEEHAGLPLPQQFVRLPGIEEDLVGRMIAEAEAVIGRRTKARGAMAAGLREKKRTKGAGVARVCVAAASQFRLWGDAGHVLTEVMGGGGAGVEVVRVDTDDPASSSPLALAMAVSECDALVTVNLGRSDWPGVLGMDQGWVTWVVAPRVPAYQAEAKGDGLILADGAWVEMARAAGWPAERVRVGGWPGKRVGTVEGGYIAIIVDTLELRPPARVEDMSSHRLLWEMIVEELGGNPFALGEDVERYLEERIERMGIEEEGFDRLMFVEKLILPAYQQGLARALAAEKWPVRLFGRGWGELAEFKECWGGVVESREAFEAAVAGAAAVVHVWPWGHAHPIDAVGRPVVRRRGQRRETFMREVKAAVGGLCSHTSPSLSREGVMVLVGGR